MLFGEGRYFGRWSTIVYVALRIVLGENFPKLVEFFFLEMQGKGPVGVGLKLWRIHDRVHNLASKQFLLTAK